MKCFILKYWIKSRQMVIAICLFVTIWSSYMYMNHNGLWTENIYHQDNTHSKHVFLILHFKFRSFQGLSDCTMMDEMPLTVADDDAVDVRKMTPHFKLCCKDRAPCTLCLVIDTEINIHTDTHVADEGPSGVDEEDYSGETRNPKGMNYMQPTDYSLLLIDHTGYI